MNFAKNHPVITIILGIGLCIVILFAVLASRTPVRSPQLYGITFSSFYAERFGLDPKEVYTAVLDDLEVRNIRVPVYWNEVEKENGIFDFSRFDWQIEEAEKRGAKIILAIGKKLPRWPECHIPEWAKKLSREEQNEKILRYISEVIVRYKDSPVISMWQIENEPFFVYGECPAIPQETLDNEITIVRALDTRPILTTDSGELSSWVSAVKRADIFGSTMYRTVWSDIFKRDLTYPLPPSFFRAKQTFARIFAKKDTPMIVIELQAEPWAKEMTYEISVERQYESMNPERFRNVLSYASRTGFDTFYLWGVEWWYWLKVTQDKPEMWEIAKEALQSVSQD